MVLHSPSSSAIINVTSILRKGAIFMANMKLYVLTDFPDDCLETYTPEMVDSLVRQFSEYGFSRLYYQYYGNQEDSYYWTTEWKGWKGNVETAKIMPNSSRVFVEACKKYGLEAAAVMRPLEQATWIAFSPYHTRGLQSGLPTIGGKLMDPTTFLKQHPELRIKRRSYDVDPGAVNKTIASIKLYKQNNIPTRIRKENITIYTSPDNSHYTPYNRDFTFTLSEESAKETVTLSVGTPDYGSKLLTEKGAPIQVITLGNLEITDQFVVIGAKCRDTCADEVRFTNTPVNGIACFDEAGNEITSSPGSDIRGTIGGRLHIDEGFNFDDGFGVYSTVTLDPDGKEGYIGLAKGKDLYTRGALCECEPLVQEYWLSMLEKAMEDGYDFFGNRIECHAIHVDEPFAYGYNDCIKEEYFKRYGVCDEKDMELEKIAKIRGDAYPKLFVEGARRVRAKGKKVYLTLNIEMLQKPIPLDRRYAYPMNVEWQWERWLEEIRPDEINFRMYKNTPKFLLNDPQCQHMLEVAKSYHVPLTVERYVTPSADMAEEYQMLNETGIFDAFIVYETASLFCGTATGEVIPWEKTKTLLPKLKELAEKK